MGNIGVTTLSIPLRMPGQTALIVRPAISGLQGDCLRVVGDRQIIQAFGSVQKPTVAVGLGKARLERDCTVFIFDALIDKAHAPIGNAAVRVGFGVARFESNRPCIVGDSLVGSAFF